MNDVIDLIKNNSFELNNLKKTASQIYEELKTTRFNKRVLATGEAMVLFDDFLNNFTFSNLACA